MSTEDISVLVVCLGNICRSPIGEAVLKHVAKERGLNITVDSAGTSSFHVGDDPDPRSVQVCKKNNVPIRHSSRQVQQSDFRKFTHVLAADESNLRTLLQIAPKNLTAEVRLWGSYLDDKPIPDPYYGGTDGFERVFDQCVKLSNSFLDSVVGKRTQGVS